MVIKQHDVPSSPSVTSDSSLEDWQHVPPNFKDSAYVLSSPSVTSDSSLEDTLATKNLTPSNVPSVKASAKAAVKLVKDHPVRPIQASTRTTTGALREKIIKVTAVKWGDQDIYSRLLESFETTTYTRIPTSGAGSHCGADALRIVLSQRFPAVTCTKRDLVGLIRDMVPDLNDFVADGDKDLDRTAGNNFFEDQLGCAVARFGAQHGQPNLVLGVISESDKGEREAHFVNEYHCRPEEAVWLWNSFNHWEALVPTQHAVKGRPLLRFVLLDESQSSADKDRSSMRQRRTQITKEV